MEEVINRGVRWIASKEGWKGSNNRIKEVKYFSWINLISPPPPPFPIRLLN